MHVELFQLQWEQVDQKLQDPQVVVMVEHLL
jgi:hypothetical protein